MSLKSDIKSSKGVKILSRVRVVCTQLTEWIENDQSLVVLDRLLPPEKTLPICLYFERCWLYAHLVAMLVTTITSLYDLTIKLFTLWEWFNICTLNLIILDRHNYKGYSLESRLHFRIHAATMQVKLLSNPDGAEGSDEASPPDTPSRESPTPPPSPWWCLSD